MAGLQIPCPPHIIQLKRTPGGVWYPGRGERGEDGEVEAKVKGGGRRGQGLHHGLRLIGFGCVCVHERGGETETGMRDRDEIQRQRQRQRQKDREAEIETKRERQTETEVEIKRYR